MSIIKLVEQIKAGEVYVYNDNPKRTANMIKLRSYYGGCDAVFWTNHFGECNHIAASEIINHVHPLIHVQLPLNY